MSYENNVPELRFEEFDDEWEEVSFKDLGSISMCKRIYKYETSENHEIPFYKIGTFGKKANTYISNETYNQYKELYPFPSKGDVLISAAGTIGRTVVYDGTPSYFQDSNIIWLDHTEENVLNEYLKHFYEIAEWDGIEGSTIQRLYNDIFLNTKVCHPDINEQNQIAKFLTNLKDVVDNKQKELTKLQNFKQAMLQKMFPKEGERMPEVRFEGFDKKWKERAMSTITNSHNNLRVPITSSDRTQGNTPYYGANGIQDYVEGFTHNGSFVLLAEDGANDLSDYPVRFVEGEIWVNNHAHVLSGIKNEADNKYLSYALKTIDMAQYLVGGSRYKLNANTLKNIGVSIPGLDEQRLIGQYFYNLDKHIQAKQAELNKLKQFKQAMLSKLFV